MAAPRTRLHVLQGWAHRASGAVAGGSICCRPSPQPQSDELCGQTGLRTGKLSSSQATGDWPASKTGPATGGDWLVPTHVCRRVTRHAKLGFLAPALQALASRKPRVSQKRTLSTALGDTDFINRHLGDAGGPWLPVRPWQCARSSARVLCVWYLKLDNIQGRAPYCGFLRARPGTFIVRAQLTPLRPDSLGPHPLPQAS